MQELNVGINAGHIIKSAVNAKSLGTLGAITDKADELAREGKTVRYYSGPDTRTFYQKYRFPRKEYRNAMKKAVEGKTPQEILKMAGIETTVCKDGSKILSGYHAPTYWCTYKELGVDEKSLLDGVSHINGDCDLTGSYLKNLAGVEQINGRLTIPLFTRLEDLSSLKSVRSIRCDAADKNIVAEVLSNLNLKCTTYALNNWSQGMTWWKREQLPFKEALNSFLSSNVYKALG